MERGRKDCCAQQAGCWVQGVSAGAALQKDPWPAARSRVSAEAPCEPLRLRKARRVGVGLWAGLGATRRT